MVPAASCPITIGGTRRPLDPSYPCTSLPQIPQAATRTSTSFGPSSGRGTSASVNFRYSLRTSDCINQEWERGRLREGERPRTSLSPTLPISPSVLKTHSLRRRPNPQHPVVRRDEQRRPVFAELAVRRAITRVEQSQLLAIRREDS